MQMGYRSVNFAMQQRESVYCFQALDLSHLQIFDGTVFRKRLEILGPKDDPSLSCRSTQRKMVGAPSNISAPQRTCMLQTDFKWMVSII